MLNSRFTCGVYTLLLLVSIGEAAADGAPLEIDIYSSRPVVTDKPVFHGAWLWVSKQSDDARKAITRQMTFVNLSAARMVHTRSGTMLLGNYRHPPTGKQVENTFRLLDSIVPIQPLVRIEHEEPAITLIYADGRRREIYTDERDLDVSVQTTAARRAQKLVFASWEQNRLVIETNSNAGITVLERYALDRETKWLYVELAIDVPRLPDVLVLNYRYQPVTFE
jgi:hypothetical protein